jgi:hypothetical protein
VRAVPLGIAILLLITPLRTLFAADPGVPAGWSALEYDNYGNDLLNKHQYAESRQYFDAALPRQSQSPPAHRRRLQRQTLASTPGAADVCSFAITSPNGANGMSDIEGKVTRVGASERGQRTSFKIVCCNFCKGLFLKAA